MPRLRQVPRSDVHERGRLIYDMLFGERCPVAEPGTATGSPGNWWTVFAGVPDCFDHAVQGFAFYRSPKRKLDAKLRELGQIRAGYARGSRFVFSQHCKACRDVGLTVERTDTPFPIAYPTAARPQAWAAGCGPSPTRRPSAWWRSPAGLCSTTGSTRSATPGFATC